MEHPYAQKTPVTCTASNDRVVRSQPLALPLSQVNCCDNASFAALHFDPASEPSSLKLGHRVSLIRKPTDLSSEVSADLQQSVAHSLPNHPFLGVPIF